MVEVLAAVAISASAESSLGCFAICWLATPKLAGANWASGGSAIVSKSTLPCGGGSTLAQLLLSCGGDGAALLFELLLKIKTEINGRINPKVNPDLPKNLDILFVSIVSTPMKSVKKLVLPDQVG
jgi:hypothetical protein